MNYYNSKGGGNILSNLPQVTRFLLIANVVAFLLNMITHGSLGKYMQLNAIHNGVWYPQSSFSPYQLITHMFMHGNFWHLFMNMFGLVMFGRILEMAISSKKFFILYFVSGLGAAGLQLFVYFLQGAPGAMVGASGAIFGVVAAFALYYPNVELIIFPLPIPIKAKYLVPIYGVIELYLGVSNFKMDNIAHFAHLGGAIFGFVLAWYWKKNQFRQF